jgi:hypothetical protein
VARATGTDDDDEGDDVDRTRGLANAMSTGRCSTAGDEDEEGDAHPASEARRLATTTETAARRIVENGSAVDDRLHGNEAGCKGETAWSHSSSCVTPVDDWRFGDDSAGDVVLVAVRKRWRVVVAFSCAAVGTREGRW